MLISECVGIVQEAHFVRHPGAYRDPDTATLMSSRGSTKFAGAGSGRLR